MPLPWEKPLPWETTPPNHAGTGQGGAAAAEDTGHPFGNPVDGHLVVSYLAEPMPVPAGAGILAAFMGSGAPKSRRQAVIEGLEAGAALPGAASDVGLEPEELQAAIAVAPGLARAVRIAMHKGDKANVGDGSGLSRWRFARTGNADKPEDGGDAGTDYNDMKGKLKALLDTEQPAPGWEPMFGAAGAG